MIFHETKIPGAFVIEPELLQDDRGFFARTWCGQDFERRGLNPHLAQCSVSFNRKKGTLRGMHFQVEPYAEAKLVRCTRGAIYDVALDLRPHSATFKKWVAAELTDENHRMLYLPEGVAHGFLTLEDNTEIFYQISEIFHPKSVRGVRWDDPVFSIQWPLPVTVIAAKDLAFPFYGK
jgi:dTDP-4-dehydrorhamnose 3,5-epimerase